MPEIDIRTDLLHRHRVALGGLNRLGNRVDPDRWAVVGGLMVLILGREHGRDDRRAEVTKDADVVVDLMTNSSTLAAVVHALTEQGFELAEGVGSGANKARCSFVFGAAQIDVLCPDDATDEQLDAAEGVRSIAIPGGLAALRTARPVELLFDDEEFNAVVRVPSLAGAIVTKAAAALDERTRGAVRHAQDTAFLLSLAEDPTIVAHVLTPTEVSLLREFEQLVGDDHHPAWNRRDDRQLVRAALRIITA